MYVMLQEMVLHVTVKALIINRWQDSELIDEAQQQSFMKKHIAC